MATSVSTGAALILVLAKTAASAVADSVTLRATLIDSALIFGLVLAFA